MLGMCSYTHKTVSLALNEVISQVEDATSVSQALCLLKYMPIKGSYGNVIKACPNHVPWQHVLLYYSLLINYPEILI